MNDDDLTEEQHKESLKKIINDHPKSNKKDDKKLLTEPQNTKIEIDESLFNMDDLAEIEDELEDLNI